MAKVTYIILCHKDAEAVGNWASAHVDAGCNVAIHFDKNGDDTEFNALTKRFSENQSILFVPRIKCGWGEWSLVQASLSALKLSEKAFPRSTHFFLVSGDCAPIKPASYISKRLDHDYKDYVETQDFLTSGWIKTGMVEDRYKYRHHFNERKSRSLFYGSLRLQRALGLKRKAPKNLKMKVGSQWWCFRRKTVEKLLSYLSKNPDIIRFFKTVWIPDESFFQTIVSHLVPENEIYNYPPTYLKFSDYGMPVTYHSDHFEFLTKQDRFYARKIPTNATDLKKDLSNYYVSGGSDVNIENNGNEIYSFLVNSGRTGKRFAQRAWERGQSVGRQNHLSIILCKNWALAEQLAAESAKILKYPHLGYVFNDENADLPDLGGLESSVEKRSRHRRATLRVVLDTLKTDHLIFCLDPAYLNIIDDFVSDECSVRLHYLNITLDRQYSAKFAHNSGLLPNPKLRENCPITDATQLKLKSEKDALFAKRYLNFTMTRPEATVETNIKNLMQFLDCTKANASAILKRMKL